jgi:hypothetical protein
MILSAAKGELGLQEQVFSGYHPGRDHRGDGLSNCRLVIVAALISAVDAAEALPQGQLRQAPCLVLLPGCPVQEARDANAVDGYGSVRHRLLLLVVRDAVRGGGRPGA